MTLAAVLLGLSVVLNLAFVVLLGNPRKQPDRPIAWFLASTGWGAVALDATLLVSVLGAHVPPLVGVAVVAVQDGIFGWRLWLMYQSRRS
jgi:amino acid transporter